MPRRPATSSLLAGAVAALAGATAGLLVVATTGHLDGWPFGGDSKPSTSASGPSHPSDPAPVTAPVVLPTATSTAPLPTKAGLTAALAGPLSDPALGSRVGAVVVDAVTGTASSVSPWLYWAEAATPQAPASTAKLVTATSALHFLGPDATLLTRTTTGSAADQVVLVGGGDPTITAKASGTYPRTASLDSLAKQTAAALAKSGRTSVRLVLDDSRFTGPRTGPGWMAADVRNGLVSRVSALTVDEARIQPGRDLRYADPTAAAGRAFVAALKNHGVKVASTKRGVAPSGATELGRVASPPISALVEHMLLESDNDLAEALAHSAGVAAGTGGSFAGGAAAADQAMTWLGVDAATIGLVDGSGISPDDRLQAQSLGAIVADARNHPELASVLSGLPISGVSGSLADRFDGVLTKPARGDVRAKTGTLTGVNSLAGTVLDRDGRTLVFVVLADKSSSDTLAVRAALDRVAAALARCGCR